MLIQFTIQGTPVGKGRPRATKTGRMYTPEKTARAEESFLAQALPYKPATPITGPVAVVIRAFFPVPASAPKKRREAMLAGKIFPGRPDLDNIAKLSLDSMNGIFFVDDAQVYALGVEKLYAETGSTYVSITWDEEQSAPPR